MHNQWLAQLLLGAVDVEQSKGNCLNSLGLLIGVQCGNRNRQRQQLKQQAEWETVHQILSASAPSRFRIINHRDAGTLK